MPDIEGQAEMGLIAWLVHTLSPQDLATKLIDFEQARTFARKAVKDLPTNTWEQNQVRQARYKEAMNEAYERICKGD